MTMYGTKLPYRVTDTDRKELRVTLPWEPDEEREFLDRVRTGRYTHPYAPLSVRLGAIDPATGDSALHIAAKSTSPLNTVKNIMSGFGPDSCIGRGPRPIYKWARHALLVHQNYDGDTALHIAARSGNQLLLTMLYRYMNDHWSAVCPEVVEMEDGPPEYAVYPYDTDDSLSTPCLLLLITKNKMGRNPAAEARHSGNEHLAEWLDAIIPRLDPDGTRLTEANVTEMIELVKYEHFHDWAKERDIYNQFGC